MGSRNLFASLKKATASVAFLKIFVLVSSDSKFEKVHLVLEEGLSVSYFVPAFLLIQPAFQVDVSAGTCALFSCPIGSGWQLSVSRGSSVYRQPHGEGGLEELCAIRRGLKNMDVSWFYRSWIV